MKKVLIVAYFFPPLGWSGVQRTLKLVKYLREYDWEPIVVTVGDSNFSLKDNDLNDDIPKDLKVIRINEVDINEYIENLKKQLVKVLNPQLRLLDHEFTDTYFQWIISNTNIIKAMLSIPDGKNFWVYNVINLLDQKIDMNTIDLIYTTSGPYSDHIIGYNLKQKYKLPWIADFRDEWTNNPYSNPDEENIIYRLHKKLETKILDTADKIITVSPVSKNNYIKNFGIEDSKISVITNGYDEEDFINLKRKENTKFTIVYNGSLYTAIHPKTFLTAINNLLKKNLIQKDRIEIKFIGKCNASILKDIESLNEYNVIKLIDYLPHKESLSHLINADLLLLIIGEDPRVKCVYTSKVFEYLRANKPILALSPKKSVVDELLNRTGCGKNFEFNDIDKIESYIKLVYDNWSYNINILTVNEEETNKYNRQLISELFSNIFNEVINYK